MMPPGPPPYPVTYKQFFITDPRTGQQTMKIQMIPVDNKQNELSEDEENNWEYDNDYSNEAIEDNFAENDDDQDSNEFWMDFLDQYYQERTHGHQPLYRHVADSDGYWGDNDYYGQDEYLRMYEQALLHDQHALRKHAYYDGYT